MKTRGLFGVLAVLGVFGWFTTVAEAGGSAGASSFNTFFECQPINGANVGVVVSTHEFTAADGSGGQVIHDSIKVGGGVLVCRQVDVRYQGGPNASQFVNGDLSSTDLKCYSVTTPGKQPPALPETDLDGFFRVTPGEAVAVVQAPKLLCGPVLRTTAP